MIAHSESHALPNDDLSKDLITPLENDLSLDNLLEQTAYISDQEACDFLIKSNPFSPNEYQDIRKQTLDFVENLKKQEPPFPLFREFLNHHQLTSEEGMALLYLAEALLRIPDSLTADLLIQDQLNAHQWSALISEDSPSLMKFSAWALSRIGTFFSSLSQQQTKKDFQKVVTQLLKKSGESVLRQTLISAVRLLGNQCIFAENSSKALRKSGEYSNFEFCYYLLGQGASTIAQAEEFYLSCAETIRTIGAAIPNTSSSFPSVAFKLSDLYPRYCLLQSQQIMTELGPKLTNLAILAKENGVGLVIEAEESSKAALTLRLIEQLITNPRLQEWSGLEVVIQAYQKKAVQSIDWLATIARRHQRKIAIRLVKGLYWDQEIRHAQEERHCTYPVYSNKQATDAAYFVCAQKMIDHSDVLISHFSTHNVFSILGVKALIRKAQETGVLIAHEFQKYYGKGAGIFAQLLKDKTMTCRLIVPIGEKTQILSSVVRHFMDSKVNHAFLYEVSKDDPSLETFVQNPFDYLSFHYQENPSLVNFLEEAKKGLSLQIIKKIDALRYKDLSESLPQYKDTVFETVPIINGIYQTGIQKPLFNPSRIEQKIGYAIDASEVQAKQALDTAFSSKMPWECLSKRLDFLKQLSALLESRLETLVYLAVIETGLTIQMAIEDFIEALRTCNQIAEDLEKHGRVVELHAIWTEKKLIQWEPKGIFVCLTAWNSPILSVVKSLCAALATGNSVVLKPSSSAGLVAAQIVECFYAAGTPKESLSFLPGSTAGFPFELLKDPRLAGIIFYGSKKISLRIRSLLCDQGKIPFAFLPHTTGVNAMIVDSSALLSQVVDETIKSAFSHSGQSPCALRLVLVQEEIAEEFIKLLKGKMMEWSLNDPVHFSTDSGPAINEKIYRKLMRHTEELYDIGTLLYKHPVTVQGGWFFPPKVYELKDVTHLNEAAFGPILHLVRFKRDQMKTIIAQLNENFPGLLLNIQSTIHSFCNDVSAEIKSTEVVVNGTLRSSMHYYSTLSLEKRLDYLKNFVTQKTIFIVK